MKKILSLLLVVVMLFTMVSCSNDKKQDSSKKTDGANGGETEDKSKDKEDKEKEAEKDPFLTGEKPELNILTGYKDYNMEEQPSYKVLEDMTGYKVNWFILPRENANEKLMLEISGGTSYDFISRIGYNMANQLYVQNALHDLKPYMDKYGENVYNAVSEIALDAVRGKNGEIYAVPQAAFDDPAPGINPYGALKGGIGFNTTHLADIGKELPTTLDEFYDVLKAYTDKTGKPALAQYAGGLNNYILSAFGMGSASWYEIDGEYVHKIKHPQIVDYLAFMQKLYKEGLLDNDFPVDTVATAKEKFTNGTSMAYTVMFWDIDGIYKAFEAANIDAKVEVATQLAKDANTKPTIYVNQGIVTTNCIPKTAKNPEHTMIWLNEISEPENFKTIYIGEEGKSYEVKDGNYHPIFPGFDDYTNADKFAGVIPAGEAFPMWQARARKTPAMAELYEQMNANIDRYNIEFYYESYAASMEAVQNNQMALDTLLNDSLIKAIVDGEDPQKAIDDIIKEWDSSGGSEYEEAMKNWYKENKGKFN